MTVTMLHQHQPDAPSIDMQEQHPPASLRVPIETTLPTTPTVTYTTTNKPKKRCNRAKTAANHDTIQAIANYAAQLFKTDQHTTEHVCYSAIHPDTGLPAEYRDLCTSSEGAEWIIEMADEMGRLAQGNTDTKIEGTNTMFFIHRHEIPEGRKPTYLRIVAADRPSKERTKRIRFTVGGD